MKRIPRKFTVTALALTVAAGASVYTATLASAEDAPTTLELLEQCNNGTDVCEFHPSGDPELFTTDAHQVGKTILNCGPGTAKQSVAWKEETGESNSVGVSIITSYKFFDVYKAELEISYGHKWGTSESTTQTTDVTVNAGEKGWLVRKTAMQRVSGTYELHFGSRYKGHYYWYVPFSITGAAPGASGGDNNVVSQMSAPMTDDEKRDAQCG